MWQIEVGGYVRGVPERTEDGTYFDILPDTMILIFFTENPTEEEKAEFVKGKAKFAFLYEEGMIFFLAKIGGNPWVDAPYNKNLLNEPVDTRRPEKGEGYGVLMILANAVDSKVEKIRMISLTNDFSNKFMDTVERQPFISKYNTLERFYTKYPTSDDMYEHAIKNDPSPVDVKKNEFGIGYIETKGSIFKEKKGGRGIWCDDCNKYLEDSDDVVIIPFLNSAYCTPCATRMLSDCKVQEPFEEEYRKKMENLYIAQFE